MTCEETLEALARGERDAAHLARCPACAASAEVLGLLEATAARPAPARLTGFAARLKARSVVQDEQRKRLAPLWAACLAGALATGGAAAVMVGLEALAPSLFSPAPAAVAAAPVEPAQVAAAEPAAAPAPATDDGLDDPDELGGYDDGVVAEPLETFSADELSRLSDVLEPDDA